MVRVSGRVAARRAGSYRYTVEYGLGVEPGDEDFVPIHVSGRRQAPQSGTLASWNIRIFLAFARRAPAAQKGAALQGERHAPHHSPQVWTVLSDLATLEPEQPLLRASFGGRLCTRFSVEKSPLERCLYLPDAALRPGGSSSFFES